MNAVQVKEGNGKEGIENIEVHPHPSSIFRWPRLEVSVVLEVPGVAERALGRRRAIVSGPLVQWHRNLFAEDRELEDGLEALLQDGGDIGALPWSLPST